MGKVFYSVGGEGRGHATRVRAMVEDLRKDHSVRIYAPAHAYELLSLAYRHSEVEVKGIRGIISKYDGQKRLDYLRTGLHSMQFMLGIPALVHDMQLEIEAESPDLVITDFEPALPRAAQRCGVPFISLNHQHFLSTYDLSSLPDHLKRRVNLMGRVVQSYYSGQLETIVSSFYFPPLKPGLENVTQIGVLLRPEILSAPTEERGHLIVYLRRFASAKILESLERLGCEIRVYGLGSRPPSGKLRFYDIDVLRFVEDLASSRALICTAGNQLVGESLYLGKPVLAMPEPNNLEQYMNAHYLQESGAGMWTEMEKLAPEVIEHFLSRLAEFRSCIDKKRMYGNPQALKIIQKHLPLPKLECGGIPDVTDMPLSVEKPRQLELAL
jgi:uncharacterized protein (TIGR00661 family)